MRSVRVRALILSCVLACLGPAMVITSNAGAAAGPAATQSGSLAALPPIAQPGSLPAEPSSAPIVSARFTPAVEGRAVQLQELVGKKWFTVQTGAQDRSGHAVFSVPSGRTYRAIAVASSGQPAVTTASATTSAWTASFDEGFAGGQPSDQWTTAAAEYAPGRTCAKPDPRALAPFENADPAISAGSVRLGVWLDPDRSSEVCAYTDPATGEPRTSPYLLNAKIESGYAFTYGYAAARMRVQRPRGMHSAFSLFPQIGGSTHVDAMSYAGQNLNQPLTGIGTWVRGSGASDGGVFPATELMKPLDDRFYDNFHVFSVQWTPSVHIFRVDGREYFRTSAGVSAGPSRLALSMLSDDSEVGLLGPKDRSFGARVDWVRVWSE